MKAYLLHPEQDFDLTRKLPPNADVLSQDLELDTLLGAMADGDEFLFMVAQRAVLLSLTDPATIVYRQRVLADCLAQPSPVRELYEIAVTAIASEKKIYGWIFRDSPDTILHRPVQVLDLFVDQFKVLRKFAEEHAQCFESEGFTRLFDMLCKELSDEYINEVEWHLRELKFRRGTLISAGLGTGNKGVHYVLGGCGSRGGYSASHLAADRVTASRSPTATRAVFMLYPT